MREKENRLDERHRKELLRFLLAMTAAVRRGVRPGELLPVRPCGARPGVEGFSGMISLKRASKANKEKGYG